MGGEDRVAGRCEPGEALPCHLPGKAFDRHPAGGQPVGDGVDELGGPEVDRAHPVDQRPAALGLELVPVAERLAHEGDVAVVVVGEAQDPRPAVRGAARVVAGEALEQNDGAAAAGERPGRRQSGGAPADHDVLDALHQLSSSARRRRGSGARRGWSRARAPR